MTAAPDVGWQAMRPDPTAASSARRLAQCISVLCKEGRPMQQERTVYRRMTSGVRRLQAMVQHGFDC